MAENKDGQEKTEDPTAKRLMDARDRGQVSKSMDTTTAALLLIGGIIVFVMTSAMFESFRHFTETIFVNSGSVLINDSNVLDYFNKLAYFLAYILMPILLLIFIVGFASEIAQVGFHWATKKFTEGVDFKRVFNPFTGLRRTMFSSRTVVELVKGIFKILLIGVVVYWVLASRFDSVVSIMTMPLRQIGPFMSDVSFELVYKVGLAYIIIALGDFAYQKWKFKDDMKMTKQEVKEERKQSEGDAKAKARIANLGRSRIQKLMLSRVKEADVVITNPTHYAVALKYEPGRMDAPKVVAKGVDYLALRIRRIAKENDIPVVEDKPLARTLYDVTEIDQYVPESLFKAVAQVLAYVYKLKDKKPV